MPRKQRSRACHACHSIKIKCELGPDGGDAPCKRCNRLGKDCFTTQPRRQKDRVAELEAQVDALTKLLKSQNIKGDNAGESLDLDSASEHKKKVSNDPEAKDELPPSDAMSAMDNVLAKPVQKTILENYVNKLQPEFSLIPLESSYVYEELRNEKPWLLQAAIYAGGVGILSADDQDEVAKVVLNMDCLNASSKINKSVEVVQAMLIVILWYRLPKFHTVITFDGLLRQAAVIAQDIGLSGPTDSSSANHGAISAHGAADVWRTWLVCCLLSANMSINTRQKNQLTWSRHDDLTLSMLEYWPHGDSSNPLFVQYARAERLCERIAVTSGLLDLDTCADIASPTVQLNMNICRGLIVDWKTQIPPQLFTPVLRIWEHVAVQYMHEPVLHTTTNKSSFSAPYLAARLSVTDFPAPIVLKEHTDSLHALRDSSHALLDEFSQLKLDTIIALPALIFAARVAYSQWILVKLYIATTAPGNTFGGFLHPESLQVDEYIQRVLQVTGKVHQYDTRCGTSRILSAALKLKEWIWNYRATLKPDVPVLSSGSKPSMLLGRDDFDFDWDTSKVMFDYGMDLSLFETLPELDVQSLKAP